MRMELKVGIVIGAVVLVGAVIWATNSKFTAPNTEMPFAAKPADKSKTGYDLAGDKTAGASRKNPTSPGPTNSSANPSTPPVNASKPPTVPEDKPRQPAEMILPKPAGTDGGTTGSPAGSTATDKQPGSLSSQPPVKEPTLPPKIDTGAGSNPGSGPTRSDPSGQKPDSSKPGASPALPLKPDNGLAAPKSETPKPGGSTTSERREVATPSSTTPLQTPSGSGSAGTPTKAPAGTNADATKSAESVHTIQSGETFSSIAREKLGSENHWKAIQDLNPGIDSTRLKVGQKIKLPSKDSLVKASPAVKPADSAAVRTAESDATKRNTTGATDNRTAGDRAVSPATKPQNDTAKPAASTETYTVSRGESLNSIALKLFKDAGRWEELFSLNRDKLSSPDKVVAGMVLRIPEVAAKSAAGNGRP